MEDSVKKIKGAGGAKGKNLIKVGIQPIKDMTAMSNNALRTLANNISGVSFIKLVEWRYCEAHEGSC